MGSRLSLETAAELLDFRGGGASPISEHAAHEQLRGAVALHNILHDEGFAYLADEVGMGKTYVALGALALFRHFDPRFRVLLIAPRQNIQKKWVKELRNFTARNVRFADLRVKALHDAPARATVLCNSLQELVHETAVDPDRDFFTRLTSFSLPIAHANPDNWKGKRDQLLAYLPWLDRELVALRNKDVFKDNYARALNCVLPTFDLVIFDEGHNIKGGFRTGAASRNRVLALAFGHPRERQVRDTGFRGYGQRAKRVLFLSATPLENDYVQLWNQLDVFGFGSQVDVLRDPNAPDEAKRECARRFLIRRVTTLSVAGRELTKNLYRREWRRGGVVTHDDPLEMPDDRQRLTVALVQKKVTEILGATRFNNSFQIGMLASFESFLETAKVAASAESENAAANFDGADQTDREDEREGVDVRSVNGLARSYRRLFGTELPHPKMDAVVSRLESSFATGEKSLVFVRRVASVKELQRKLEERYDHYLFQRLRTELKPALLPSLERMIAQYSRERVAELERQRGARTAREKLFVLDEEAVVEETATDDQGGVDTFFAWFFRGDGPGGRILSGATLQKRFSQAGSVHSTFFEDNHVAALLGVSPDMVVAKLADRLDRSNDDLVADIAQRAALHLPRVKKQQRRNLFLAVQEAALWTISQSGTELATQARVIHEERYRTGDLAHRGARELPEAAKWLELGTFWTALRQRPLLKEALWPDSQASDPRARFREAELRRELLSAMTRLGHPFIDLYILSVNRLERLALRAREQEDGDESDLATDFLDLLERQMKRGDCYTSYMELHEAAANFHLILTVNEPGARTELLDSAAKLFGRLLRAQQPIGGMSGQVNETLVRQFRMPGYPLVLISTDLLQEGEDLHTFCSRVHHYGISWMPSSMEQRVGRVDRVSSQTDRRLTKRTETPTGDDLLQVYYPHLTETLELLQVRRVIERLNRFMRLMHEDLGGAEREERSLDVSTEIIRTEWQLKQIDTPLRTAFPVREEMLEGPRLSLAVSSSAVNELRDRFRRLHGQALGDHVIHWDDVVGVSALLGTFRLRTRQQPFTLLLRSVEGNAVIRCVSPVGVLDEGLLTEENMRHAVQGMGVRIGAVHDRTFQTYNLTIEGDILLGAPLHDASRVSWLLRQVTAVADRLEEDLLRTDRPLSDFRTDLDREVVYER